MPFLNDSREGEHKLIKNITLAALSILVVLLSFNSVVAIGTQTTIANLSIPNNTGVEMAYTISIAKGTTQAFNQSIILASGESFNISVAQNNEETHPLPPPPPPPTPTTVVSIHATNAGSPKISGYPYLPENIAFDSVSNKYWWIFEDRSGNVNSIRLASCPTVDGNYSVEPSPVIQMSYGVGSPHLVKFDTYWYIYYINYSDYTTCAQRSLVVNSGYTTTGIINPIIPKGISGTWDCALAGEPFVFEKNGIYYCFYMGMPSLSGPEKVGYATSTSPTGGFMKYSGNPVIGDVSDGWNSGLCRAADPFMFEKDGIYYFGIAGNNVPNISVPWRTGFYKTTDFITFTCLQNNPGLNVGTSGQFDSQAAWRGAVINVGGTYFYSYGGYDGTTYRMGMTTLEFD